MRSTRDELLATRICDLGLAIEGTALEARVARLFDDLGRAGLRFRPHVWLSTDWFTPDGVIGFAIPFFLAHPRLTRLEHREMFEVEGGGHEGCMKLLRHETGHAIDNAYRLRRRKRYRELFGSPSMPYRDSYAPRPSTREFVQHLDQWYAQSHPVEDFAETFAVWLTPRGSWRRAYAGWPVMTKLDYVDELMQEVASAAPVVASRARPDPLSSVKMTLGEYYATKKRHYAREASRAWDPLLERLFSTEPDRHRRRAAAFLRSNREDLRNRVADLTGQYRYVVDQVLKSLILRCKENGYWLRRSEPETRVDAAVTLTVLTMRFLRNGRPEFQR